MSVMEWDEGVVNGFVVSVLKEEQYEDQIYEQGITGDVLIAMDHDTLHDIGMSSLGHRLKVLRAVWEVKREQGIELGEGDWRPADMPDEEHKREVERLNDSILELQERLLNLERDHVRMLNALDEQGIAVPMASSADGDVMHGIAPSAGRGTAPPAGRWGNYEEGDEAGPSRSRLLPSSSSVPQPPLSSDSATFAETYTPTTSSAPYAAAFDSPSHLMPSAEKSGPPPNLNSSIRGQGQGSRPAFSRTDSSGAQSQPSPPLAQADHQRNTPSKPTPSLGPSPFGPQTGLLPALSPGMAGGSSLTSASSTATSTSPAAPLDTQRERETSTATTASATGSTSGTSASAAKESASRAAKSFRVTLEDPCWKVLPAALKKYKIHDDWKLYALFICFGNTERCLSYDEKPLMLFQKLKEGGMKPVFMLRHIRDIKSPIAVAQQKQAVKLGLPANSNVNVLPKCRPSTDTAVSPTKPASGPVPSSSNLQPSRRTEEAFPDLISPGAREGEGGGGSKLQLQQQQHQLQQQKQHGTIVDKDGNVQNVTYAVAIYPYIADREDEYDVAVGATFTILSKTKGWYIVQKDPDGLGQVTQDNARSGWVPAGCLLELTDPISRVSPGIAPGEQLPTYPGLAPLLPTSIMSSSYPGVVLMDYGKKAGDELDVKEGQNVRVYKKYCHWSYAIKAETGERGWIPAWFIGKLAGGSSTDSNPSTATFTAAPRSAADPSVAPAPASASASAQTPVSAATTHSSTDSADKGTYQPAPPVSGGTGRDEEGEQIGFDGDGGDDGGAGVAALKGYL